MIYVLFSGETSAGKSTLINKILENEIFLGHTLESTSTICKIRNLERAKVITKRKTGEVVDLVLPEPFDIRDESNLETLQELLTDLTDMTVSKASREFEYVDVGFPIPFLKVMTFQYTMLKKKFASFL